MAASERLFFALWPPADLQARAHALARKWVRRGRVLPAANLHLTLVFLGEVDAAGRAAAMAAAAGVRAAAFELNLTRLGCWQRRGIVWLGPQHVPPALVGLHAELARRLAEAGFPREARPFSPHLTVARRAVLVPQTLSEGLRWAVDEFRLMRSELGAKGAAYTTVGSWPLGAPGVGGTP